MQPSHILLDYLLIQDRWRFEQLRDLILLTLLILAVPILIILHNRQKKRYARRETSWYLSIVIFNYIIVVWIMGFVLEAYRWAGALSENGFWLGLLCSVFAIAIYDLGVLWHTRFFRHPYLPKPPRQRRH